MPVPNSGTWTIEASFWTMYEEAVVSMHIGNGGGDPDQWGWEIITNATGGVWNLVQNSGSGGGLSNLKLWGRGLKTPNPNPVPGILVLMGIGLFGLVGGSMARRRFMA